jgi:hypothetical protein
MFFLDEELDIEISDGNLPVFIQDSRHDDLSLGICIDPLFSLAPRIPIGQTRHPQQISHSPTPLPALVTR